MQRRQFLSNSALVCGGVIASGIARSDEDPIRIILAGYGPPSSSFSQALTHIGNRLTDKFGDDVEVRYVYNIMDLAYKSGGDLLWLVDSGVLSLAYMTMFNNIPALQVAALPFLFKDSATARAAMDGALGQSAIETIEADSDLRVLGFFENGFRHVSNSVRPVHGPADLDGLTIRVLGAQSRTLDLMGANSKVTLLPAVYGGCLLYTSDAADEEDR